MSTPSPLITGVDFVTVATSDFDAATSFYGEILGLRCTVRYARVPGAEFETGNLTLQVIDSDAAGLAHRPSPHPVALRVEDVHAVREELQRRGVQFSGETLDTGVCLMAFFADPDGNALILHQRYTPRT
jgi:catechol 2,3-dioxygenase-like lactoylglutathione lyase family enzyme